MPSNVLYSLLPCLRKEEKYAHRSFLDNGSKLLEDLIASCDGKSNPIRHYSANELIGATNNFHPSCHIEFHPFSYRGFLDNRLVIVKKSQGRDAAIRDIIISIQMSSHKNVLKLLGCCLEFPVPALVHEYATHGQLVKYVGGFGDNEALPWRIRLRIAKQVADSITYLHTAFPRPIIHRNLSLSSIILDSDFVPKLRDFSYSVTIPPEQWQVQEDSWVGTYGFLDPATMRSGYISEKTDVYSFGVLLLVFLTGRRAVEDDTFGNTLAQYVKLNACDGQVIQKIVDLKILEELRGDDEQAQQQQLHDFLALALSCIQDEREVRPEMIDVARELIRIEKSVMPS